MTPTVADAIERILSAMPERLAPGLDTVKHGDPAAALRGIAVTFMATRAVAARAAGLGANLVVTHEPSFWNHADETAWLGADPVLAAKRAALDASGLVVWRLHDHLHRGWPDLIAEGVLDALGWQGRAVPAEPGVVRIPAMPLAALAGHLRGRLGLAGVRVVGDAAQPCAGIAFLPGAWGGRRQIELLRQPGIDVVVCGESPEWETCEYVRDALAAGIPKALVVLGHANSEEAGMRLLSERIRPLFPGIAVHHLPAGDPFRWQA